LQNPLLVDIYQRGNPVACVLLFTSLNMTLTKDEAAFYFYICITSVLFSKEKNDISFQLTNKVPLQSWLRV